MVAGGLLIGRRHRRRPARVRAGRLPRARAARRRPRRRHASPSARRSRRARSCACTRATPRSADRDLRDALGLRVAALGGATPAGALVFSCNGRGRGMFGEPTTTRCALDDELAGAPRRASSPPARSARSAAILTLHCTSRCSPRPWQYSRDVNLAGRTVLLTGATRRARPRDRARARTRAGAQLVLTGRRADVLEPLAAETGAAARWRSTSPTATRSSASPPTTPTSTSSSRTRRCPRAATCCRFTVEEIDRALDVNLRAPIVLARLIGERMAARGNGHLVFMSSLSGKAGTLRAARLLRRRSSACAASRSACARTCARAASACRGLPRLHPRRGHVRRLGREAPARRRDRGPRGRRRRRRAGDRAQPRRDRRRARRHAGGHRVRRASPPRSRRP